MKTTYNLEQKIENIFSQILDNLNWLSIKVKKKLLILVVVTLIWFLADYLFFVIFQLYLKSIGVIDSSEPNSIDTFYLFVAVMGLGIIRTTLSGIKIHSSNLLYQSFLKFYRYNILDKSLNNFNSVKQHESQALFNEIIFQGGQYWQSIATIISNGVVLFLLVIFSIYQFRIHFLMCAILTVSAYLMTDRFLKALEKDTNSVVEKSYSLSKFFNETLKNSMFFNVYQLNEKLLEITNKHLESYNSLYAKFSLLQSTKSSLPSILGFISIISYCHYCYLSNEITADVFLSFFYIFFRIAQLLGEISGSIHAAKINLNSSLKIQQWILSFPDAKKSSHPSGISKYSEFKIKAISIEKLSFGYTDSRTVIQNLNYTFRDGDIIHITGASGAGKSTLLTILLNLQKNYSGTIKINDMDIKNLDSIYSEKISYVGPTPFFMDSTILENLLLGNKNKETVINEKINSLLKSVGLSEEIQKRGGLESNFSENNTFSTGQIQRLSIVRALLREPDILFLDEATANLDLDSELKVKEVIKENCKNKIIFIISHKGSIADITNKVINL